jgi:pimeloyl-ACP methyl ester carboxylesterase
VVVFLIFLAFIFIDLILFVIFAEFIMRNGTNEPDPTLPAGQFIEINGHSNYYVRTGTGPTLLLLHGLGASLYSWRFLIDDLSKDFDVVAIDLLGFGQSSKSRKVMLDLDSQTNNIVELMVQLDIMNAILVGSSMGGALGLWVAQATGQNRITKVIAISPTTDSRLAPPAILPNFLAVPIGLALINRWTMVYILKYFVGLKKLVTRDSVQSYLEPFRFKPAAINAFLRATSLIRDNRLPKDLQKVQQPVLLIRGENDKIVPMKFVQELHEILPRSEFLQVPNSGHHPHEDSHSFVSHAVRNFLAK